MGLTLADITFAYGRGRAYEVTALHDVSVSVEVGELVLVVGSTGSGKSTLMRVAAGLLAAQSGSATIDGAPLDASSARGAVGLVFQDAESQLFADTLLDDVAFGPKNLGLPEDRAHEAARDSLASVGLDPTAFADRSPFSLSGGEARRAAIAGVLAMQPRYLLADEPTAGLDAAGRRLVRELLLEQVGRAGVVVVSHVAEEFLGEADRVVVLEAGGVAWQGSAADAVADPTVFSRCGLRAPDVLEVQRLSLDRAPDLELTLDPELAAARLAAARGAAR